MIKLLYLFFLNSFFLTVTQLEEGKNELIKIPKSHGYIIRPFSKCSHCYASTPYTKTTFLNPDDTLSQFLKNTHTDFPKNHQSKGLSALALDLDTSLNTKVDIQDDDFAPAYDVSSLSNKELDSLLNIWGYDNIFLVSCPCLRDTYCVVIEAPNEYYTIEKLNLSLLKTSFKHLNNIKKIWGMYLLTQAMLQGEFITQIPFPNNHPQNILKIKKYLKKLKKCYKNKVYTES